MGGVSNYPSVKSQSPKSCLVWHIYAIKSCFLHYIMVWKFGARNLQSESSELTFVLPYVCTEYEVPTVYARGRGAGGGLRGGTSLDQPQNSSSKQSIPYPCRPLDTALCISIEYGTLQVAPIQRAAKGLSSASIMGTCHCVLIQEIEDESAQRRNVLPERSLAGRGVRDRCVEPRRLVAHHFSVQ